MKFLLTAVIAAIIGTSSFAETNLLNNADLKLGRDGFPMDWNMDFQSLKDYFEFGKDENGKGIVTFKPSSGVVLLTQKDMQLVPGGKYRIGAWVKTRDLKSKRGAIVIYNTFWTKQAVAGVLPENTVGWQKISADVTVPDSIFQLYSFGIFTDQCQSGELSVKSPFVEALTSETVKVSRRGPAISDLKRLIPVGTPLFKLSSEKPELVFSYRADLSGEESDYDCRVEIKMNDSPKSTAGVFKLEKSFVTARFDKLPIGDGKVQATLIHRKTGKTEAVSDYLLRVNKSISRSDATEKRLNTMVKRLLTVSCGDGEYPLNIGKDGWIFVSSDAWSANTKFFLDNSELKNVSPRGDAFDAIVFLEAGPHKIRIFGSSGGEMAVNSIPEILIYNYPQNGLDANFRGDFLKKYLFPCTTTFNHGSLYNVPENAKPEALSIGKQWMGYYGFGFRIMNPLPEPREIGDLLSNVYFMKQPGFSGLTFDEIDIEYTKFKLNYAEALRSLQTLPRSIYTYSSGVKFDINALNAEYFSAAVNVSRGNGKFIFECYARTQPTEQDAKNYLEEYLVDTIRRADTLYPGAAKHSVICHGLYSRPGIYCTDIFTEPDVKVFYDMYFNLLANRKEFTDLHGVGIYAYGPNGDEEAIRWVSRLIRHYFLEGKRETLSEKYGYRYIPGHLKDGDFACGSKYWKVVSANKNSVEFIKLPNYGRQIQKRRFDKTVDTGDSVCVFRPEANKPNTISQIMTGFVPGKTYSLSYIVADQEEVKAQKGSGAPHPVKVELSGAETITDSTPLSRYFNTISRPESKVFTRHIVIFKPERTEVKLSFNDSGAVVPKGKQYILNFVKVNPYYSE